MFRDKLFNKVIIIALTFALVFTMAGTPYALNALAAEGHNNIVLASTEDEVNNIVEPQAIPIVGMLVADVLITWLTRAVVATLVIEGVAAIDAIFETVNANRNRTEYKYYMVTYDWSGEGTLKTRKALNFAEALVYIQTGKESNVWTPNSNDAYVLAKAVTGRPPEGPENEWATGVLGKRYYWHYHDSNRKAGHVFFGNEFKYGQDYRPTSIIEDKEVIDLAS